MKDTSFLVLLVFFSVDALALLALLIFQIHKRIRHNKIRHFGDRAEEIVSETLLREFPGSVLMNNVFLQTKTGFTQIDHILLCKWGVYVIETKSHNGKINIGKKVWVQIYGDKVVRFHSPLLQNEIHKKAVASVLQKYRHLSRIPVNGIVVFTSQKMYFSQREAGVLRLQEVSPYIKSGGKTLSRKSPLTAQPGVKYLSRQKINALEKAIRKNRVKSTRKQKLHDKKVRNLDRRFV